MNSKKSSTNVVNILSYHPWIKIITISFDPNNYYILSKLNSIFLFYLLKGSIKHVECIFNQKS